MLVNALTHNEQWAIHLLQYLLIFSNVKIQIFIVTVQVNLRILPDKCLHFINVLIHFQINYN